MSFYLPKPELLPAGAQANIDLIGIGGDEDLIGIRLYTASASVSAQDPLAVAPVSGGGLQVAPIDGSSSVAIAWAGVALNDAAAGEEVAVVVHGPAIVTKATGTAWALGDVVGADTGAAATCTVSAQDLDGVNVAKKDLGWCIVAAASGDDTGTVYVSL